MFNLVALNVKNMDYNKTLKRQYIHVLLKKGKNNSRSSYRN